MDKIKRPDFIRRDADGAEIYQLDHYIGAERRIVKNDKHVQQSALDNAETETSEPDESGVVRQKWRFISAIQAWPTTAYGLPQLVDYGWDGGVALSGAVNLINESSPDFRWNHSVDAKDVAGHITDSTWEQSTDIVPGITGYVVVDPNFDAKAAIGISKGIIRSGSIGISAEMTKSHPDMEIEEFLSNQGEEIDGDVVRWKLKNVVEVRHMAMLATGTGADPNAGLRYKSTFTNSAGQQPVKSIGGKKMIDEKTVHPDNGLLSAVCSLLKVDESILENTELAQAKLSERIEKLQDRADKFSHLSQSIADLEKLVIAENETGLSVNDIIERLPQRLDYARHGERFLVEKRDEALKAFDSANVKADENMSDNVKRLRSRIENSKDIDFVLEMLELHQGIAEERFSLNRSSIVEELPQDKKSVVGAKEQRIRDGAKKLFGGK